MGIRRPTRPGSVRSPKRHPITRMRQFGAIRRPRGSSARTAACVQPTEVRRHATRRSVTVRGAPTGPAVPVIGEAHIAAPCLARTHRGVHRGDRHPGRPHGRGPRGGGRSPRHHPRRGAGPSARGPDRPLARGNQVDLDLECAAPAPATADAVACLRPPGTPDGPDVACRWALRPTSCAAGRSCSALQTLRRGIRRGRRTRRIEERRSARHERPGPIVRARPRLPMIAPARARHGSVSPQRDAQGTKATAWDGSGAGSPPRIPSHTRHDAGGGRVDRTSLFGPAAGTRSPDDGPCRRPPAGPAHRRRRPRRPTRQACGRRRRAVKPGVTSPPVLRMAERIGQGHDQPRPPVRRDGRIRLGPPRAGWRNRTRPGPPHGWRSERSGCRPGSAPGYGRHDNASAAPDRHPRARGPRADGGTGGPCPHRARRCHSPCR